MPPEAKVAIFENDPDLVDTYRFSLEKAGHQVVGVATTMEECGELIPKLGELGVEVVLLDEHLDAQDHRNYIEGRTVVRGIRGRYPKVKILDISAFGTVGGADTSLSKTRMIGQRLDIGKFVTIF